MTDDKRGFLSEGWRQEAELGIASCFGPVAARPVFPADGTVGSRSARDGRWRAWNFKESAAKKIGALISEGEDLGELAQDIVQFFVADGQRGQEPEDRGAGRQSQYASFHQLYQVGGGFLFQLDANH